MKVVRFLAYCLALVALPISVEGAPDTPPSMVWELTLPEPSGDPCNAFSDHQSVIQHVRVGPDGYIYTGEYCNEASTDTFLIRRVAPNGVIIWTSHFTQSTVDLSLQSIAVDPDNRVWIWYDDPAQAVQTRFLAVVNKNQGVDFTESNGGFSNSNSITSTSFEEISATSFRAYAGGPAARIAYSCTAQTVCTQLYDLSGQPGTDTHHAAPYFDTLYGFDGNTGSGDGAVSIVNQDTGTLLDTETVSGFAATGAQGNLYYNPTTDALGMPYGKTSGTFQNQYLEWNKTTLATIRDVSPIEPRTYPYDTNVPTDGFIDGDGSAFYCGAAQTGGVSWDSYLAKYNTTSQMGMRWNITISKVASTNRDMVNSCDIAPDGSIYIGIEACSNGSTECSSYLRKYGGALGRSPQTIFTQYTGGSATPSAAPGNIVRTASDFCSDAWGFDCDWLFAMAIVGIAVVASRHAHVLVIATVLFLALGVSTLMGVLPEWVMFVFVFLVIVFAGVKLFGGNGDSNGGD